MNNKEIIKKIKEKEIELKNVQGEKCEVWSRVVGYYQNVNNWNKGKYEEFKERKTFNIEV